MEVGMRLELPAPRMQNAGKARQYYSQLVELSGNNGANREELAQAQAFLKNTN